MARIFDDRPVIEYIEISMKSVKEAQQCAVAIADDLATSSPSTLNGGAKSPLWEAFAKSLFAFILRDVGRGPTGAIFVAGIRREVIDNALARFRKDLELNAAVLYSDWEASLRQRIETLFTKNDRVFESYIIGELCQRFYVEEQDAQIIMDDMKNRGLIETVGSKYGTQLVGLTDIPLS